MKEYEGYGIEFSPFLLKSDAYKILFDMIQKSDSDLKTDLKEFYESNRTERSFLSLEDSFYDFCSDGYENKSTGRSGVYELLTEFINEQACNGKRRFVFEDWVIHVPAGIPETESDKKDYPTQDMITQILCKYAGPLYKKPLDVQWFDIHIN